MRPITLRAVGWFLALFAALLFSPQRGAALNLQFQFTMPAGIDPDRKIFFGFSGDSDTFTGSDLLTGAAGVELHVVSGSNLLVDMVIVSLEGIAPNCLSPLTGEVISVIDTIEFPTVSIPWLSIPPSPFPLTLTAQPGAVLIGEPISSISGFGLAYGILELTGSSKAELLALDPDCLDEFLNLNFRATGLGMIVPEPGLPVFCGGAALTLFVWRTRRHKPGC